MNEQVVRIRKDYHDVFGTNAGKRVLKDMMRRGHVISPVTTAGDPCLTAFRDGQRSVILSILSMLNVQEDDTEMVRTALGKDPLELLIPQGESDDG